MLHQQTRHSLPLLQLLVLLAVSAVSAAGPGLGCGHSWQQAVCQDAVIRFSFSDGCNTVTCDGSGEFFTTLMMCPVAATPAEKSQCENIRRSVQAQVEASWNLACPLLDMPAVCATALKGFVYNDGCNTAICDGAGSGSTTMMACPEPVTDAEAAACQRRAKKVIARLESRTCRGLDSAAICRARGIGFRYSDGCNGIECGPNGVATSTMMMCPDAPDTSAICRLARRLTQGAVDAASATGRTGAQSSRAFACPELAFRRVCTASTVGFRYSDGCNSVHCVSAGSAVSSFMLCEEPTANETKAADAYCRQKEAEVAQKRAQSKPHYRCMSAADVCVTGAERKAYFDGCNYCFCMGPGRAGCTRRACHPYFSTDDEFAEECKRRNVGIIN